MTTTPPAPPTPPEPVALDLSRVAEPINGALMNGTPVVVAYVDGEGKPHVSLRGTAQVLDATTMAVWARDPNGGMPKAMAGNPNVALFYRDHNTRTTIRIAGRGRVTDDAALRDRIYESSPEIERMMDADRKGVAIVIDVDTCDGRDAGGVFRMTR